MIPRTPIRRFKTRVTGCGSDRASESLGQKNGPRQNMRMTGFILTGLRCGPVKQRGWERKGPEISSEIWSQETGRFRVQISLADSYGRDSTLGLSYHVWWALNLDLLGLSYVGQIASVEGS